MTNYWVKSPQNNKYLLKRFKGSELFAIAKNFVVQIISVLLKM